MRSASAVANYVWLTDGFLLCCKKLGWVLGSNHHRRGQTDAAVTSKTRWDGRDESQNRSSKMPASAPYRVQ